MNKVVLKKIGEKVANLPIQSRCFPFIFHQPTPPAKIKEKLNKK